MSADFDPTKMYSYMKGYCAAMGWSDGLQALAFAREKHAPQMRKGGQPYIIHPLSMACQAVSLNLKDEDIIVACLLHDVVEDCNVLAGELPIKSERARAAIVHLTHISGDPLDIYYRGIYGNEVASLVKLLDRCDNVSTMAGVFSPEKTMSYIEETRDYVMPLWRGTKDKFPQYSNALFVLKYHILSVIDGLEKCLLMLDEQEKELPVRESCIIMPGDTFVEDSPSARDAKAKETDVDADAVGGDVANPFGDDEKPRADKVGDVPDFFGEKPRQNKVGDVPDLFGDDKPQQNKVVM